MKNKDEETIIPESPTISEMLGNEDDDERGESRDRSSRGKRRTAREIANMFDQLKQRHVARKKEWQSEKNELIKKVQMADESKRVLAELKMILENLREELKHEENKRLGMEVSHIAEKMEWDTEREELMRSLEESDKEGATRAELTAKLSDQARQLADWQTDVLELKRQMLVKEQRYLKERKKMEAELERERESWKKKEKTLSEKIRMLDSKSTLSSSSGASPSSTPFPSTMDIDVSHEGKNSGSHHLARRRSSTSSAQEATSTKYNTFQRTVDNALKQIEKISEDLKHIDESTSNNESPDPASKPLLQHSMPSIGFSPCPPCATPTLSQSSHDSDPTINAPWRTRRRSNVLKHPKPEIHVDNSGTGKSTDASNAAYKSKSSPAPIAHPEITKSKLSPTVNTAQLRMSAEPRSPNPQRRVKKIDRQGSQVDIVISSPEGTNLPTAAHSRDIRLHKSPVPYVEQSDTSSSPAFADKSQGFNRSTFETAPVRRKAQNKSPLALTPRLESNVPTLDKTHMISVKNSPYQTPKPSAVVAPMKMEYVAKDRTQEDKMLVVKRDGSTATGRSSPKLPKLHQQLLFKDFPASGAVLPKQGSDEGKAKYDSSSNESWRMLSTDKSEEDRIKTDTPYFDPNTGYVPKVRAKKKDSFRNDQPDALNVGKTAVASSTKPHVGSAMASLGRGLVVMDRENTAVAPPPVVQPKPKVSIQKDADGNILVRPKDKEGKDTAISDRISPEKGGHSLAGRVGNVGKAGRDWIKKKLNFKDRKDSEQDSDEKIRATPSAGDSLDYGKRKSRTKIRERSSSLLRSFNGRSVTSRARDDKSTSEESNVSDGGVRRRESFLKRSKKKGKKVSVASTDPKTSSPTKSRPKRYTRSKTDVSTLEMKNFLTKFKVSQSNPKKPSVLKQFELKLLENEVKTIEDEKQLRKHNETRGENKKSLGNAETTSGASTKAQDEGYSGEDEGDYDNLEKGNDSTERLALPTIRQGNIPFREKRGPPVKTKPYYRRSMNDLHLIGNGTEMGDQGRFGANTTLWTKDEAELPAIDRQSTGVKEADEVCSRKGVSSLVDRFSAIQESKDEHGDDPAKPMNKTAGRYSFRVPSTGSNENGFENGALQRSHSMSSPSSTTAYWRKKRPVSLGVGFEEPEITKAAASQQSPSDAGFATWRDVVMSKPLETPTVNNARSPPSEYSFLKADWPKDAKDDLKPGRSRVLSEDMRRKAEMVEQVLAKGPRKPKMYRRADTQPFSSVYTSSEEEEDASDTDRGFEEAFKPFLNDFKKTERTKRVELDPEDLEKNPDSLPSIIPPVTTKFSKPTKPGRLPSRWAR